MDIGLKQAGFDICVHVDNDPYCVKTLKKNWSNVPVVEKDISLVSGRELLLVAGLKKSEVSLIVGGPSCQPFSRSNEGKRKGTKDARGQMIFEFARIVDEIKPKAFLMENVVGLLSSNKGKDFTQLIKTFKKSGYNIFYQVLNAVNYGVPQKRKRLFVAGFKKQVDFSFPSPTHGYEKGLKPPVSSGKVLKRFDDGIKHNGKKAVGGKWGHLINKVPPGMNYIYFTREYSNKHVLFKDRSKFWTFLLKLDPNQPSTTIQSQPWNSVGPFHWNNRRLKLKEIMKLQSIPLKYYISGIKGRKDEYGSPSWMQIGNAVPPPLAKVVGKCILSRLSKD